MKSATDEIMASRAVALAIMHLTRRDDLKVSERPASLDYGVDLLVTVCKARKPTGRWFGVQVKGVVSERQLRHRNRPIGVEPVERVGAWAKSIPFPVCLFVFTMENDCGRFRWVKEPILTSDNSPKLRLIADGSLFPLTNGGIAELVARVNEWYDRQEATSTAA